MVQGVRRSYLAVALLLASGAAAPVMAAPILQVTGGLLVGASGVSVNGNLYDVSFTDGSCATVYDGCDASSDLPFRTLAEAQAASQALLDQVFVDGPSGLFDTVPALTFGCVQATTECLVWTPYTTNVFYGIALNTNSNDVVGSGSGPRSLAFSGFPEFVLAAWTPAATAAVPEPASLALLAFGLAGVGVGTGGSVRRVRAAHAAVPAWAGDPFVHAAFGSNRSAQPLPLRIKTKKGWITPAPFAFHDPVCEFGLCGVAPSPPTCANARQAKGHQGHRRRLGNRVSDGANKIHRAARTGSVEIRNDQTVYR